MLRVAAGELPETLRISRPGALVAFGKRDVVSPGYGAAATAARAGGFEAIERLAGGRAAVFHEGTISYAHATADTDPRTHVTERFEATARLIASALASLGVDARVGEVDGEYCPGEHSVNARGRRKLMGVGQRLVRGGVHVGAVVVVEGADRGQRRARPRLLRARPRLAARGDWQRLRRGARRELARRRRGDRGGLRRTARARAGGGRHRDARARPPARSRAPCGRGHGARAGNRAAMRTGAASAVFLVRSVHRALTRAASRLYARLRQPINTNQNPYTFHAYSQTCHLGRFVGLGTLLAVVVVLTLPGLSGVGRGADPSMCDTTTHSPMGALDTWTAFASHCADPGVVIDSGPSGVSSSTGASFGFRSPEGGGYFECSLDGAAWAQCASPQVYSGLGQGQHSFRVQAAYDWDPGAHGPIAQRTWTVETAGASARTGDYPQASFSKQRLTDRSGLGVNVSNGNLLVDNEDLGIAGTGLDLEIGRVYNSLSGSVGSLGRGWGMGTGEDVRIRVEEDESVTFYDRTGSVLAFQRRADGAGFESPLGVHATLRQVRFTAHELTDHETGEKLSFTSSGPESFGRLTARRDRYGNAISFAYNGGGELSSITDTQGRVVTVTQGPSGRIAGLTDPTGRTVGYTYNAQGLLEIYTDAAGGQTRYGYDTAGRLGSITTPGGRVTKITYDAQGRVETVVRTTDAARTSGPTTRFAYGSGSPCASGETRTVVSDPLAPGAAGHTVTYCGDGRDRVTKTVDSSGNATTVTYGATGDVASVRRPLGGVTNYGFDPATRNLLCVQRGATSVQSCTGGSGGLKTTFAYANTDVLTGHFPTRVTNPQGHSVVLCWNGSTPGCGSSSGPAGSLRSVTNALSAENVSRFSYDSRGNPTSATDARGFVTSYGYDGQGNLTGVTPPAGAGLGSRSVSPDALGRPGTVTDGKGQTASYAYDRLDRPTALTHPGGPSFGFGYDRDGNRTSLSDPSGISAYSFDQLGRLVGEQFPGGSSNAYGFDAASNLTAITDAGGTTSYAYDGLNRLASLSAPGDTAATTFAYNPDGARTQIEYPSGVSVDTGYDIASGRVVSATNRAPSGSVLKSFAYTYKDPSGRDTELVQTATDQAGNRTINTYDPLDRLTEAVTSGGPDPSRFKYELDGEGNRLSQTFNRSASTGGVSETYAYDPAGLPCWRASGTHPSECESKPPDVGTQTYTHDRNASDLYNSHQRWEYNAAGQASSVSVFQADGQTSSLAYRGPGQGQLIQDGSYTVGHNLLGVASRERTAPPDDTTHRPQSAAEPCAGATGATAGAQSTSERSTTNTEPSHYARTTDGTLVSQRGAGGRANYLYDGQGTVIGLTDQDGALQTDYTYEPYGHPANLTPLGNENPFGYLGTYTAGVEDQGVLCGGPSQIDGAYYDAEDGRNTQSGYQDPITSVPPLIPVQDPISSVPPLQDLDMLGQSDDDHEGFSTCQKLGLGAHGASVASGAGGIVASGFAPPAAGPLFIASGVTGLAGLGFDLLAHQTGC